MTGFLRYLALTLCLGTAVAARADLLGDTFSVELDSEEPAQCFGCAPLHFTAPGTADYLLFHVTITADQIIFTTYSHGRFPDGGDFREVDDLTADRMVAGITLDPASTLKGGYSLDDYGYSNGGRSLGFVFGGQPYYSPGQQAIFDLTFADSTAATPEPTTVGLVATGVLGMLTQGARRRFGR